MRKSALLFLVGFACTGQAQVVTLDSVLRTIDRTHPMLKMYDAMAASRQTYADGASSWMPPKFTAGLWQAPYATPGNGMVMLGIEQMIPNPSKADAKAAMMQSEAAVDTASREYERNDLYAMAKRTYYGWSVLKRKTLVLSETDSLMSFIIRVATERYPSGKELLENIYKAKAARADLRSMQLMIASEIRMKNIELNRLLNFRRGTEFDIDTSLPKRIELPFIDTGVVASVPQQSRIQQVEAQIAMMHAKRDYARSMLYPDFGISATHMQAPGTMPNLFSVMAMVSIPIAPWSRGETDAMTAGIDEELESLRLKEQAIYDDAHRDADMIAEQLKSSREQLENYEQNTLPAYSKSFDVALDAYEQNSGDLFRVIDAWQMLRIAEMNRLDQLQTILNLQVNYEQTMEIR